MTEIEYMSDKVDFNNLTYYFTSLNINSLNFIKFKGPMHICDNIKNGETSIEKVEKDQKQFKPDLNEKTRGNPRYKKEYQLNTRANI